MSEPARKLERPAPVYARATEAGDCSLCESGFLAGAPVIVRGAEVAHVECGNWVVEWLPAGETTA